MPPVVEAEQAVDAAEYVHALELLGDLQLPTARAPRLALRKLVAEAWAHFSLGDVERALDCLERARPIGERPECLDLDRAQVLFQLGCCRLTLGAVANAVSLLTLALDLCDHSVLPADRLRARILEWRSRCYERQRDLEAARADVERALELAQALGDEAILAQVYFQASVVAERQRQWLLARFYADEARALLERLGDWVILGRALTNLGGLNLLVGDPEAAVACLREAVSIAAARGSEVDVGRAVSSLARVHLRCDELEQAEQEARRALDLLGDRVDQQAEAGGTQLVLARALLGQGRLEEAEQACRRAEDSLRNVGGAGHSADAVMVHAEVAERAGDLRKAADLYRRAAEALQDVHF
jgi:tetratricopeptide (TPR) repeat protein